MSRGVTAIPIRLNRDPRLTPHVQCSASYAADTLLLCGFVIALGIPAFYVAGFTMSVAVMLLYFAAALAVPCGAALGVWWLRWGRPRAGVCGSVCKHVITFAVPALAVATVAVTLGQQLAFVGIAAMAFAAGVAVAANSALFRYDGGSRAMTVIRLTCAISTPLIVLGLTNGLPGGLVAVQGWSVPFAVTAAGALGARAAMRCHLEGV